MSYLLRKFNQSRIGIYFEKIKQNRHFKYGAPFIILIVGAPFVLQKICSVRYEYRNAQLMTPDQEKEFFENNPNIKKRPASEITLEKIYEETVKDTPDDYQMIRGPRPWEDNSQYNKQVEELTEKNKDKGKMFRKENIQKFKRKEDYGL